MADKGPWAFEFVFSLFLFSLLSLLFALLKMLKLKNKKPEPFWGSGSLRLGYA